MAENSTHSSPLHFDEAAFDIVALAASAGGLSALSAVLSGLPAGFPATIVIVQHLDPRHRSLMADILSRRTPLLVKQAEERDRVAPAAMARWGCRPSMLDLPHCSLCHSEDRSACFEQARELNNFVHVRSRPFAQNDKSSGVL